MAPFVFIGVTIIGFSRHGPHFLSLFVPEGRADGAAAAAGADRDHVLLVRPISLSVRLFANMMAGHTMLKVFGGFVVMLGILGGWAPLAFIVVLTGLEFADRLPAGLRLHHPDLHLSQRRGPSASLSVHPPSNIEKGLEMDALQPSSSAPASPPSPSPASASASATSSAASSRARCATRRRRRGVRQRAAGLRADRSRCAVRAGHRAPAPVRVLSTRAKSANDAFAAASRLAGERLGAGRRCGRPACRSSTTKLRPAARLAGDRFRWALPGDVEARGAAHLRHAGEAPGQDPGRPRCGREGQRGYPGPGRGLREAPGRRARGRPQADARAERSRQRGGDGAASRSSRQDRRADRRGREAHRRAARRRHARAGEMAEDIGQEVYAKLAGQPADQAALDAKVAAAA